MLPEKIEKLLKHYVDPYLGLDLISAKKIKADYTTSGDLVLRVALGYPARSEQALLRTRLRTYLDENIEVHFDESIQVHAAKPGLNKLPNIKNVIVVASGKGGVGKSTVAVNLAVALSREGASVGILDADIYGPSQPAMLGASHEKPVIKDKKIHPIVRYGLASMSIGYLVDINAAMVWRGPMLGKAMEQLIYDTVWPALDYLIIDLPPGTGDVQLSLCQKIPIQGAVIVTTPQDIALLDVGRACEMFTKLDVPLLGMIENMAHFQCSQCGHETHIFGQGGAEALGKKYDLPLLAKIPLNAAICMESDRGTPTAVDEKHPLAQPFYTAAKKAAAQLSLRTVDHSTKFPKIVVKHD